MPWVNYVVAGCATTSITYVFLCHLLRKGRAVQNITTWLLWAALDIVIGASVIYQGGNWPFIAVYVAGCVAVAITIFRSSTVFWTWYETAVAISVFVCMIVWAFSGAWAATVIGTIAVVIAGVPQFIDILKRPWENPILIYIGFLVGNIFSTAAGKDWSVGERLYPASMAFFVSFTF